MDKNKENWGQNFKVFKSYISKIIRSILLKLVANKLESMNLVTNRAVFSVFSVILFLEGYKNRASKFGKFTHLFTQWPKVMMLTAKSVLLVTSYAYKDHLYQKSMSCVK